MDEIWIYQFARRIVYHHIPYRDYCMIVTPFKAQLDSIILRVFTDQLFVLRLVAYFTAIINSYILFLIAQRLGFSKNKQYILVFAFLFSFTLFPINNYNWLSVFLLTLILFILLLEKNTLHVFFLGFFATLLLLTKQNMGTYTLIGLFLYKIKFRSKFGFSFVIGMFCVFIPEVIYFKFHYALGDFLSVFYRVIISFYNERIFFHSILSYLIPICLIIGIVCMFITIKEEKRTCLFLFALIALGFTFPIFDITHFLFSVPFLVLFFLDYYSPKSKVVAYSLFFLLFFRGFSWSIKIQDASCSNLAHYQYVPIENITKNNMEMVVNYIKLKQSSGTTCYVIDFKNVRYDIALDRFSFKYDSMMRESQGIEGEREVIKKISENNNVDILLFSKYTNKQQQTKISEYVKENFQKIPSFNQDYLLFSRLKR